MRAKTISSFCNSTSAERKIDVWSFFFNGQPPGHGTKDKLLPSPGSGLQPANCLDTIREPTRAINQVGAKRSQRAQDQAQSSSELSKCNNHRRKASPGMAAWKGVPSPNGLRSSLLPASAKNGTPPEMQFPLHFLPISLPIDFQALNAIYFSLLDSLIH